MGEPAQPSNSSVNVAGRLKGVIFDMDGTLVSSLPLIVHCVNEMSEKYLNRKLTLEEVIATFGPAAREIVQRFTNHLGEDQSRSAIQDYYKCYRHNLSVKALLFPGMQELLGKLRRSRRQLAVFTGVERLLMETTLDGFGLSDYFDVLIAGDDVQKSKPDPEGVYLALERMNLTPVVAMIVGDSPTDIIAGRKAHVVTGAAMWSPEGRGDPSKENPDFQFRSVRELERFFFPVKNNKEPGFYFSPNLEKVT